TASCHSAGVFGSVTYGSIDNPDTWRYYVHIMTATPAEWPTADEAAARLHMTRRNLDRYIRDRKIASREDPQPGRTRPVIRVHPGDIERIASEQRQRMAVVQ